MHRFDLSMLDARRASRLLTSLVTPRPIAWVVSVDRDQRLNAAPFSFFNIVCSAPAILAIGIQPRKAGGFKDTRANIEATGEFVTCLVPDAAAKDMNQTSVDMPPDHDEVAYGGLRTSPSTDIEVPRLDCSPVAFECRLRQIIDFGGGHGLILGDILQAHVTDEAIVDIAGCEVDASRLGLIARMHGSGWYARSTDLFFMPRPQPRA